MHSINNQWHFLVKEMPLIVHGMCCTISVEYWMCPHVLCPLLCVLVYCVPFFLCVLMYCVPYYVSSYIVSLIIAVTHVVSSVNAEGMCPRTLKYLQAVSCGKWIVNFDCEYRLFIRSVGYPQLTLVPMGIVVVSPSFGIFSYRLGPGKKWKNKTWTRSKARYMLLL